MRRALRQVILLIVLLLVGAPAPAAGPQGAVLSDGTVRFETGSAKLTAESERVLDRLAALLKRRPELDPVELVGHADDRGAEAVNRALSLRRAQEVRKALVKRGIRASRVRTRGAGSAEPLSRADTEAARELNRRVEVWITPQRPVAEVTEVQRIVRAREAASPEWQDARVGQSLRRLARVRTGKRSASEVAFRSKDHVQLGPEALVVIYDSPRRTRGARTDVADIEVEQGTIFASMAAKDREMRVKTKPSRVDVRSTRTRVDVRKQRRRRAAARRAAKARAKAAAEARAEAQEAEPDKQVSTVSVFEGRSDVSAQGKSVRVREGFGTRVEEGKAPEPPRPLPVAPAWATPDPYVVLEGRPLDLRWRRAPAVEAVEVQLGGPEDPNVERPSRLWRVEGDGTRGGGAPAGLHHLRLVGVDDRDVSGAPGRSLRLIALPQPEGADGAPWPTAGGRVRLTRPGQLVLPAPPGLAFSSTTSTSALTRTFVRPGLHELPLELVAGSTVVKDRLQIWVDTATLTASVSAPEVFEGRSRTEIVVEVATGAGPVDGLELLGGVVPMPTERLAVGADSKAPLVDCRCGRPPSASPAEPLGEGRYRWVLERPLPAPTKAVTVRLFEPRGRLAAELPVPVADAASARQARAVQTDPRGLFGGLRLGALVSHADAPSAELSAELGYRLRLGRGLELDLSLEAGWLSRDVNDRTVHAFPLLGRLALGLDLGAPRLYAGGGAGLRLLSEGPDPEPAATGFAGFGYRIGHSEILLEGAYRMVGRAPALDEDLAGWSVILGYRLGTFFTAK